MDGLKTTGRAAAPLNLHFYVARPYTAGTANVWMPWHGMVLRRRKVAPKTIRLLRYGSSDAVYAAIASMSSSVRFFTTCFINAPAELLLAPA